ncbi:MAG: hypothetical protein IJP48_11700 [Synergistaceae bacterium]|nr:hypothetical protein [Synergistaceae bacterium]
MKKFILALLIIMSCVSFALAEELSLTIDKEKGEIIIPAEVNGKYLVSPTKHALSYFKGGNGEKSIMRALVSEIDYYNALVELGAVPGDNIKAEDMKAKSSAEGKSTEGSKVSVFLTWEGSNGEVSLDDAIISTVANGEVRKLDLRFSGNLEFASKYHPGCFICLDSCAAGITTNAAWPTGAMNNKEVSFKGNPDTLPPDGTRVNVIVRLVK